MKVPFEAFFVSAKMGRLWGAAARAEARARRKTFSKPGTSSPTFLSYLVLSIGCILSISPSFSKLCRRHSSRSRGLTLPPFHPEMTLFPISALLLFGLGGMEWSIQRQFRSGLPAVSHSSTSTSSRDGHWLQVLLLFSVWFFVQAKSLVPHVFPACGHVQGYAKQLAWGPCPMCRTPGHLVEVPN